MNRVLCYISPLQLMILLLGSLCFFTSCEKKIEEVKEPVFEKGTVTDIDGNTYETVKIGDRWWMAENLKTTKFRDGSDITFISRVNPLRWDTINASAYCQYEDNVSAPGFLYNWHAVNDSRGLAPDGWRIATDEDWKELERHAGMSSNDADGLAWRGTYEGDHLKVKAPEGWTRFGTVWGDNKTGFSALAGSCRLFNGNYGVPGLKQTGFWWTSSSSESGQAWYRYLDYKKSQVFRSHIMHSYGMSVRCVKD